MKHVFYIPDEDSGAAITFAFDDEQFAVLKQILAEQQMEEPSSNMKSRYIFSKTTPKKSPVASSSSSLFVSFAPIHNACLHDDHGDSEYCD